MTHKNKKNLEISCLKCLYGGVRINKLQLLIKKPKQNFHFTIFFGFWSSKPWIWIGIQLKMLDPGSVNTAPKHCSWIPKILHGVYKELFYNQKIGSLSKEL
jgi:hypothetical protein